MKEILQQIWREVLDLDNLPETTVSFFDIGGNSFFAAQVIAMLEERTGMTADVVDFYDNETIEEFVKLLEE